MRVLIIADDLTGALDSAATLTGAGMHCVVARRPDDVSAALAQRPDVLSINTASREGSSESAVAAVVSALDAVRDLPDIIFKKVDSRLKGHVADEIAALVNRSGHARALVAPAIPTQGRAVERGRVVGAGIDAPIDAAAAMDGAGLAFDVPDTRSDDDLNTALARALDGSPTLLVGAAGLAAAVARRLAAGAWAIPKPRLRAPILLAIGSHDPITLAQVDCLDAMGSVASVLAPDGACPAAISGGATLVHLVAVEGRAFDPRTAGSRFAKGIAQLVNAGRVRTLLGCGGETADAILGALGQGVLIIEGEILPGVPVSSILLGERRLQLVTKSGGFGDQHALASIVEAADPLEGAR
jgi:D-threonate/D-erythronate kinase